MLQSDKSEFNTRYQSPEYELLQVFYYYHHYCYYNYYVFIVFQNGALLSFKKSMVPEQRPLLTSVWWGNVDFSDAHPQSSGFVYLKNMRHFNYFISYAMF